MVTKWGIDPVSEELAADEPVMAEPETDPQIFDAGVPAAGVGVGAPGAKPAAVVTVTDPVIQAPQVGLPSQEAPAGNVSGFLWAGVHLGLTQNS